MSNTSHNRHVTVIWWAKNLWPLCNTFCFGVASDNKPHVFLACSNEQMHAERSWPLIKLAWHEVQIAVSKGYSCSVVSVPVTCSAGEMRIHSKELPTLHSTCQTLFTVCMVCKSSMAAQNPACSIIQVDFSKLPGFKRSKFFVSYVLLYFPSIFDKLV